MVLHAMDTVSTTHVFMITAQHSRCIRACRSFSIGPGAVITNCCTSSTFTTSPSLPARMWAWTHSSSRATAARAGTSSGYVAWVRARDMCWLNARVMASHSGSNARVGGDAEDGAVTSMTLDEAGRVSDTKGYTAMQERVHTSRNCRRGRHLSSARNFVSADGGGGGGGASTSSSSSSSVISSGLLL